MSPDDHISIITMAKNELRMHFPPFHLTKSKDVEKKISSAVGITTSMLSNLEREVQRRMEADERQMDPIDWTMGDSARVDGEFQFNSKEQQLATSGASSKVCVVADGGCVREIGGLVDLEKKGCLEIKEWTADWLLQAIDTKKKEIEQKRKKRERGKNNGTLKVLEINGSHGRLL